jgi:hypothetical protein
MKWNQRCRAKHKIHCFLVVVSCASASFALVCSSWFTSSSSLFFSRSSSSLSCCSNISLSAAPFVPLSTSLHDISNLLLSALFFSSSWNTSVSTGQNVLRILATPNSKIKNATKVTRPVIHHGSSFPKSLMKPSRTLYASDSFVAYI